MDNGALAFYFTDKGTKAQKGKVLCLSAHKSVWGPEVLFSTPAPLCFSLLRLSCALAGMSMKRREKLLTELLACGIPNETQLEDSPHMMVPHRKQETEVLPP